MSPQLGGTGRLADDLYLVAHHEISGKPRLQPRALGLGLAGGLLGELMLAGSIQLWHGRVIIAGGTPPGDALARSLLAQVTSEQQHLPPRLWLLFVARTAAGDVAARLHQAGYLTRTPAPLRWRAARWVPADPDTAFAPLVRVKAALSSRDPAAAQNVALGGLATACGLGHQLSLYLPPGASRSLDAAISRLDPGLQALIAQTQAAVDSALLAHRV